MTTEKTTKTKAKPKAKAPRGRSKAALKDPAEKQSRSAAPVLDAFNGDTPALTEPQVLLARFASQGIDGLNDRERHVLQTSGLLDKLSVQVEQHREKRVMPEEVNELKMQEYALQEALRRLGQLEMQKSELVQQVKAFQQKQAAFLAEIGKKYRVEPNSNWVVDLDTGKIVIKERLPEPQH